MPSAIVPKIQEPIAGPGGFTSRAWYAYFESLRVAANGNAAIQKAIDSILARLAALEDDAEVDFQILGVGSVLVQGSVADGMVQLTLAGDENEPGRTFLYGTGPDGAKGWHRLYDAVEGGVGIAITDSGYTVLGEVDTPGDLPATGNAGEAWRVLDPAGLYAWDGAAFALDEAATGVVGFALAELPDTGIGAALVKTTRDAYGRVEGQAAATASDLAFVPAGGITATDVQAAIVQAAASGGGEILVQDGSSAPPVMLTNEAEDDFVYSD